ncbi:RNI-like protein [Rhizoclosmatium globosum]|uniref:RNI-like protein n=1 Tax=Rhizoclosmatium globosum TaxID=329046 RepID=A0A1Y2CQQ8_9FUNG|nr:RNI-like protein [Rhizoclosmatium globosum]|eukprot:ORY48685.1 RNI-like protein [Rhizoclosmatium globosum]
MSKDCDTLKKAFPWLHMCCTPGTGIGVTQQLMLPIYVSCDGSKNILTLKISMSISGSISTQLGALSNLNSLDLSGNNLEGQIPTELGNLSRLTKLDLSSNQLTGNVPTELAQMQQLRSIRLSQNHLNGTVPAALLKLPFNNFDRNCFPDLPRQDSTCVFNKFAKPLPSVNNDCENLAIALLKLKFPLVVPRAITFASLAVQGQLPDELFALSQLTTLRFNNNGLDSTIPPSIGNATNLNLIDFGFNNMYGDIPQELVNLQSLEVLILNNNKFQGPIPNFLANMTTLAVLNLANNHFSGPVPPSLTIFLSQFDHNCLSGTSLPNQSDCVESYSQFVGKVTGGAVAGFLVICALMIYFYRVYNKVIEAQRASDSLEWYSSDKIVENGLLLPKKKDGERRVRGPIQL